MPANERKRRGSPVDEPPLALVRPVDAAKRSAFVVCHSEGHEWRHRGKVGGSEAGVRPPLEMTDAVARYSVCESCASERFRWYTRSGEVIPRYRYPEGYLHKKQSVDDEPAPSKLWWRQQLVIELFEDMTPRRRPRRKQAS